MEQDFLTKFFIDKRAFIIDAHKFLHTINIPKKEY